MLVTQQWVFLASSPGSFRAWYTVCMRVITMEFHGDRILLGLCPYTNDVTASFAAKNSHCFSFPKSLGTRLGTHSVVCHTALGWSKHFRYIPYTRIDWALTYVHILVNPGG
jgi:hypothetical protein